ncbi:MAG: alpha/beta hydrolase [Amphritea sp.]
MTIRYHLSDAMRRFVQRSEAFFPSAVVEQGLAAQRTAYDAMADHFSPPRPASLCINDEFLNSVRIRRYRPPQHNRQQRVLFAHGGGWYLGGLDSHDSFCASLAHDCNMTVIAVDYRLAPEAPYPAGLDDLTAVYRALLEEDPVPPLLVGDSAGGNLVAALALRCRKSGLPKACGQILIYPALAAPDSLPSHQLLTDAPLLDRDSINFCWQIYAQEHPVTDEELIPLQAESLAFLPPAAIFAAEFDPLVDDARQYSQRLRQAGTPAQLTVIRGLVHGALRAASITDEANLLYQSVCAKVKKLTN